MKADIGQEIDKIATQLTEQIIGISSYLYEHPELSDHEFASSAYLAELLEKNGFRVTYPYCGIATAFRAETGTRAGIKVAFLAEYDALPGFGPQQQPGHACGHNWIAASALGAAIILSKLAVPFNGTVVVLGTPAEETVGRKIDMIERGAFNDIDAVFQMHLNTRTNLSVSALAVDSLLFEFTGRASHAAVCPFRGVNALDAVNLTFAGINALRQQLPPDVRVHGIITNGGDAPNIIPAFASAKMYVRAAERFRLDEVTEKVKNCARGAALMTGAELKISRFENSFDSLQINQTLLSLMRRNLSFFGISDFADEPEQLGSTDTGNVSHRVPTFYGTIGVGNGSNGIHEEAFLEYVDSPEAHDKLIKTAKAFAASAFELFTDHSLADLS